MGEEVPQAPVLADPAYGNDGQFRQGLTKLGLDQDFRFALLSEAQPLIQFAHQNQPPSELTREPWNSSLSEVLKEG